MVTERTNSGEPVVRRVEANGIGIQVAEAGRGPAVLLLHGWPHTWRVWREVIADLAADHRVIAPDLRGLGGTDKPESGYDLDALADDAAGLLEALGVERAALVAGIDLGTPIAWMTAVRHRSRIERLAVMEGLLGTLPGAEAFLASGPPWWFGFHRVPGLPETLLAGRTDLYIDWFLRAGTHGGRGVAPDLREALLAAYRDEAAFRGGLAHYRAMPDNARRIALAARQPLALPVLALGGNAVGNALALQLAPSTPDLEAEILPDCGHIIPADAPGALAARLRRFIAER